MAVAVAVAIYETLAIVERLAIQGQRGIQVMPEPQEIQVLPLTQLHLTVCLLHQELLIRLLLMGNLLCLGTRNEKISC